MPPESEPVAPHCDHTVGCITCGDEATPMRVVRAGGSAGLALCRDDEGTETEVEVALVAPVAPGDTVLVHAAVALGRLDPAEAA
jgi:hydrogenase maturation factor